MKISIYTIKNTLFEGEAESLTLPTPQGEITILANHLPLLTLVNPGRIHYTFSGTRSFIETKGGLMEVRPNSEIVVLAEEI